MGYAAFLKTLKNYSFRHTTVTLYIFCVTYTLESYIIVYYKSLSESNWLENDYNWAGFYSNKILCVGLEGNKILFLITNMTNYYLFYVIIAIW